MPLNLKNTISPYDEMIAYEVLNYILSASSKKISEMFRNNNLLPSQLLHNQKQIVSDDPTNNIKKLLEKKKGKFSVALHRRLQYPNKLRDAEYPLELFYYRGNIDLTETKCISVVGARDCSSEGLKKAENVVKRLVEHKYTIVSGLAKGVDTAALKTAIHEKGNTIAVIGTPIDKYYPRENQELQDFIANNHLLISQVPFYFYEKQNFKSKRYYFPMRNVTMSALSIATIIVEASEKSGTLTQARACLKQGRKLFILKSCFENPNLTWPHKYEKQGAIKVESMADIIRGLEQ